MALLEDDMITNHYGKPLSVRVANGQLIIELGTDVLAHAACYSDWANPYDETRQDYIRTFAIVHPLVFAADVQRAMLAEREDGSTPLSDFLDAMAQAALDDGSVACEYDQVITSGKHAPSETWAKGTS